MNKRKAQCILVHSITSAVNICVGLYMLKLVGFNFSALTHLQIFVGTMAIMFFAEGSKEFLKIGLVVFVEFIELILRGKDV